MNDNPYYRCPWCSKNYRLSTPKGGDGTGYLIRKHSRRVYLTGGNYKHEFCPGSYHLVSGEELWEGTIRKIK